MKTMEVVIARTQTIHALVSVPNHWTPAITRRRMTPPVIAEINEPTDDFDWEDNHTQFSVDSVTPIHDRSHVVDYEFDDEPAPPRPVQMALIAGVEP